MQGVGGYATILEVLCSLSCGREAINTVACLFPYVLTYPKSCCLTCPSNTNHTLELTHINQMVDGLNLVLGETPMNIKGFIGMLDTLDDTMLLDTMGFGFI